MFFILNYIKYLRKYLKQTVNCFTILPFHYFSQYKYITKFKSSFSYELVIDHLCS